MRRTNYVHGSAARELELEREVLERSVWEGGASERQPGLSITNWMLLILMFVILVSGFVYSIRLRSEIAVARNKYTQAQAEYEKIKDENDNVEEAIQNDINMEEVRRIATAELGMKLPGEGQVVTYSSDINDYVVQYADVTPR